MASAFLCISHSSGRVCSTARSSNDQFSRSEIDNQFSAAVDVLHALKAIALEP